MGAVERLVAKMRPKTDEVALARVWVPRHPSTYMGKPTDVEGHWSTRRNLMSDELKALKADPLASKAADLAEEAEKRGGSFFEGGWQWKGEYGLNRAGIFGDTKDLGYGGASFMSKTKAALIQPTPKGFQLTISKRNGKVAKTITVDTMEEAFKRGEDEIRTLGDKLKKRGPAKWAPKDVAGGKGTGGINAAGIRSIN